MLRQNGKAGNGANENAISSNVSQNESQRRKKWLRKGFFKRIRRTVKRKWRFMATLGLSVLLLATLLTCLIAFVERWGEKEYEVNVVSSQIVNSESSSPSAPLTEVPNFFNDRPIPKIFTDYSERHNSITANPFFGKYLLYEIPTATNLPNSLLGLTSAFVLAVLSERALLVQWTESYEAPGPYDIGGGAGDWEYSFNSNATAHVERTSSLDEIFLQPGFWWDWVRFADRWTTKFEREVEEIEVVEVSVKEEMDLVMCSDLKKWRYADKFVKVTDTHYFASLLAFNPHHTHTLFKEISSSELFPYISNWILRPVPSVMMAVQRFSDRYFENNFVIGLEMTLSQSRSEWGTMSDMQQKLFFQEATEATYRASQQISSMKSDEKKGVMVLVVTDDEEALRSRLKGQEHDTLGAAGIIAITGPHGIGTKRILSELQELWLLGNSDMCIISSGSAMGSVGHSRTGIAPIVITESLTSYQSPLTQPCFEGRDDIEHLSCFNPDMLAEFDSDPSLPCYFERRKKRRKTANVSFRRKSQSKKIRSQKVLSVHIDR